MSSIITHCCLFSCVVIMSFQKNGTQIVNSLRMNWFIEIKWTKNYIFTNNSSVLWLNQLYDLLWCLVVTCFTGIRFTGEKTQKFELSTIQPNIICRLLLNKWVRFKVIKISAQFGEWTQNTRALRTLWMPFSTDKYNVHLHSRDRL